jgi:hypothetical protein
MRFDAIEALSPGHVSFSVFFRPPFPAGNSGRFREMNPAEETLKEPISHCLQNLRRPH